MHPALIRGGTLVRAIGHELRAERITFMAGSLAYNAFVSLLPLLVLMLVLVSEIDALQLESMLLSLTNAAVTPGASDVLISEVQVVSTEVSILGGALLIWGALRIFRTIDAAFSEIYETTARNTLPNQLFDAIIVFCSITAVIFVAGAIQSVITVDTGFTAGWLGQRSILIVGVACALLPMYYLFPDEPDITVLELVPGVLFSATGLVFFESLFQLYLAFSSTAARESILASILVFLTWLYFSGLILLVGAAINAVFANRSHNVDVRPLIAGVPATENSTHIPHCEMGAVVGQLAGKLSQGQRMEFVIDDESISVPTPVRVDANVKSSRLPFLNDTVGITLVWNSDSADGSTDDVQVAAVPEDADVAAETADTSSDAAADHPETSP